MGHKGQLPPGSLCPYFKDTPPPPPPQKKAFGNNEPILMKIEAEIMWT